MKKYLSIILLILCMVSPSWGAVLFSDNFDAQIDWNSSLGTVPTGWYDAGSVQNTISENTMQIKGGAGFFYGSSGKGYVHYNESLSEAACGPSVWCSDGLLGASFTATDDIYIRFRFKFQTGWQFVTTGNGGSMKIIHVSHYGGGNLYTFHGDTENFPRFVSTFGIDPDVDDLRIYAVTHGYEGQENYWNPHNGAYLGETGEAGTSLGCDWPGCFNANQWYTFEYRIKLNSAKDVADGIVEMWVDGVKEFSKSTIAWVLSTMPNLGGISAYRWNHVWLGGNNYNNYNTGGAEQWYAVDDFCVSDSYIGEAVCGATAVPNLTGVTITGGQVQ
jgi:hypothetical protein